jgi:hypothetical protein
MEPDQDDEGDACLNASFEALLSRVLPPPTNDMKQQAWARADNCRRKLEELRDLVVAEFDWWDQTWGVLRVHRATRNTASTQVSVLMLCISTLKMFARPNAFGVNLALLVDVGAHWRTHSYYEIAKCFHKSPTYKRDPVKQRERALQLRDEIEAILFPS